MLVKKFYHDHKRRQRKRNWHLQQLDKELMEEVDSEEYERDMTAFMEDLEEDNRVTIGTSTSFLVRCMYMCSDIDKTYTYHPDMMYM